MQSGFVIVLVVAIAAVTVAIAALAIRRERGQPRGMAPGKGEHVIEVEYSSGGLGGGHSGRIRVPRDPQDYARIFVPRESEKDKRE